MRAVGDGIEWHAGPADNKTVVSVAPGPDGTTLRVDARQHGLKALAYIGVTSAGLLAGGISIALWHAPGAAIAAVALVHPSREHAPCGTVTSTATDSASGGCSTP